MGNKCQIQSPIKLWSSVLLHQVHLSHLHCTIVNIWNHLRCIVMNSLITESVGYSGETVLMHNDLNTFLHGFIKGRCREGDLDSHIPWKLLQKISGSAHDINILKQVVIGWATSVTRTILFSSSPHQTL